MNIATLLGLITGLAVLVGSILTATGNAWIFWNPHGLAIVLGGVIAATFISFPMKDVLRLFVSFLKVLRREDLPITNYIAEILIIARKAMGSGTLKLEKELDGVENFFLQDGLRMVVDQYPQVKIRQIMETSIATMKMREMAEADIFRTMARFAPAFGMVGTLIGLIVMFQNLEADPGVIGPAMGSAMMSTFYGLILANLFFNPIAVKMERRVEQREILMRVILEGVILVSQRTPPQIVEDELRAFVPARKWADLKGQNDLERE